MFGPRHSSPNPAVTSSSPMPPNVGSIPTIPPMGTAAPHMRLFNPMSMQMSMPQMSLAQMIPQMSIPQMTPGLVATNALPWGAGVMSNLPMIPTGVPTYIPAQFAMPGTSIPGAAVQYVPQGIQSESALCSTNQNKEHNSDKRRDDDDRHGDRKHHHSRHKRDSSSKHHKRKRKHHHRDSGSPEQDRSERGRSDREKDERLSYGSGREIMERSTYSPNRDSGVRDNYSASSNRNSRSVHSPSRDRGSHVSSKSDRERDKIHKHKRHSRSPGSVRERRGSDRSTGGAILLDDRDGERVRSRSSGAILREDIDSDDSRLRDDNLRSRGSGAILREDRGSDDSRSKSRAILREDNNLRSRSRGAILREDNSFRNRGSGAILREDCDSDDSRSRSRTILLEDDVLRSRSSGAILREDCDSDDSRSRTGAIFRDDKHSRSRSSGAILREDRDSNDSRSKSKAILRDDVNSRSRSSGAILREDNRSRSGGAILLEDRDNDDLRSRGVRTNFRENRSIDDLRSRSGTVLHEDRNDDRPRSGAILLEDRDNDTSRSRTSGAILLEDRGSGDLRSRSSRAILREDRQDDKLRPRSDTILLEDRGNDNLRSSRSGGSISHEDRRDKLKSKSITSLLSDRDNDKMRSKTSGAILREDRNDGDLRLRNERNDSLSSRSGSNLREDKKSRGERAISHEDRVSDDLRSKSVTKLQEDHISDDLKSKSGTNLHEDRVSDDLRSKSGTNLQEDRISDDLRSRTETILPEDRTDVDDVDVDEARSKKEDGEVLLEDGEIESDGDDIINCSDVIDEIGVTDQKFESHNRHSETSSKHETEHRHSKHGHGHGKRHSPKGSKHDKHHKKHDSPKKGHRKKHHHSSGHCEGDRLHDKKHRPKRSVSPRGRTGALLLDDRDERPLLLEDRVPFNTSRGRSLSPPRRSGAILLDDRDDGPLLLEDSVPLNTSTGRSLSPRGRSGALLLDDRDERPLLLEDRVQFNTSRGRSLTPPRRSGAILLDDRDNGPLLIEDFAPLSTETGRTGAVLLEDRDPGYDLDLDNRGHRSRSVLDRNSSRFESSVNLRDSDYLSSRDDFGHSRVSISAEPRGSSLDLDNSRYSDRDLGQGYDEGRGRVPLDRELSVDSRGRSGPVLLENNNVVTSQRDIGTDNVRTGRSGALLLEDRNSESPLNKGHQVKKEFSFYKGHRGKKGHGLHKGQHFNKVQGFNKGQGQNKSPGFNKGQTLNKSPGFNKGQTLNKSPGFNKGQRQNKSPGFHKGQGLNNKSEFNKGQRFNKDQGLNKSPGFNKGQEFNKSQGFKMGQGVNKSPGFNRGQPQGQGQKGRGKAVKGQGKRGKKTDRGRNQKQSGNVDLKRSRSLSKSDLRLKLDALEIGEPENKKRKVWEPAPDDISTAKCIRTASAATIEELGTLFSEPVADWIRCSAADLYFKKDPKTGNMVTTKRMQDLEEVFDNELVQRAAKVTALQEPYERPAVKPNWKHKCRSNHHNCGGGEDHQHDHTSLSSSDSSSSDSDSDSEDWWMEEFKFKQNHPYRLHKEVWYNDPNELNYGPLCRCSYKARKFGIRHSIYPGEEPLPMCDLTSNNLDKLYHYRVNVSPVKNFLINEPTVIMFDEHEYIFEGFSIFSHQPIPKFPDCELIRFNIIYTIHVVEEQVPENFSVRSLDLFSEYLFEEILELVDIDWRGPGDGNQCRRYHIMPRFARPFPENGKELLSMNDVLLYLLKASKPLMTQKDLDEMYQLDSENWTKFVDSFRHMVVTCPGKKPSSIRIDQLDKTGCITPEGYKFPIIIHHGVRPAQLSYAGDPIYRKKWREYMKYRHLLWTRCKIGAKEKEKLDEFEADLEKIRLKCTMKREVTAEITSEGFVLTGIRADICQHAMLLPVLIEHLRFHESLSNLERKIKYKFNDRSLLQLALTHSSYKINYGTNPDHGRNSLSNCGFRQVKFGDFKMHHQHTRKRGLYILMKIMAKMGHKEEVRSEIPHNERLEFLGDAVVEYITSTHLFNMIPQASEGELTLYRGSLVQNAHLAVLADKLRLQDYLLYAHGPDLCHDSNLKHAMANCFEAFLGALFLDGGIELADRVFSENLFDEEDLLDTWMNTPPHPLISDEPNGDRHWIEQSPILQKLTCFEEEIGYDFKHIRLLAKAFTQRNVGYNNLTFGHNQRLEFLGDTVMQLICSEYLFRHFPDHHEGHLTLLRSSLVNNKTQSTVAAELGMPDYVIKANMMKVDEKSVMSVDLKTKEKADLLEALLGALLIDGGLEPCKILIEVCFFPRLQDFILDQEWNDPKSELQQCCLTLRDINDETPDIPVYKVLKASGPTNQRTYTVAVYFREKRLAVGVGGAKQLAEMKAAETALNDPNGLFRNRIFKTRNRMIQSVTSKFDTKSDTTQTTKTEVT